MKSLVFLTVLVCFLGGVQSAWLNKFNHPFTFTCPPGQSIVHIRSINSNAYQDRRWHLHCAPSGVTPICFWTGYVNLMTQPLLYQCYNYAISGMSSYHSNNYQDRRFRFRCCLFPSGKQLKHCRFSSFYHNVFDGQLNYYVPSNKVLRGAFSYFSRFYQDRRWKFEICDKP